MTQGLVPHDESCLDFADLVEWFVPAGRTTRLVGLEVECGLVRPDSGCSVSYDEPAGTRALLEALLDRLDSEPILESGALVGLTLPDGGTLTLEMAGAIEYSSAPVATVTESLRRGRECLVEVARIAEPLGLRVLTGGQLPFDRPGSIKWAPKGRTEIMRRYFAGLGDGGRLGDQVMGLTLSTQISLDALDAEEYLDKLRVLLGVSPFLAAVLANTPALAPADPGDPGTAGLVSHRMAYWRKIDPARCQHLTARLYEVSSLAELTAVLTDLPMIYRRSGDGYVPGGDRPFREVLRDGFGDDTMPTLADWKTHLAQLWPAVRPRRTLETRLPDGQAWHHLGVIPALFVGLVEDPAVRREVAGLLAAFRTEALDLITLKAAEGGPDGIAAPVREVTAQLVALADRGLAARVAAGGESPDVLRLLDPAREWAASGRPPAEALRAAWAGPWRQRPDRYVAAMAVPAG
ncbi:glutamate-cysteine ligase family protein [Micromonospora endolithica]|uniref:glutamate--cysteine ligase n=1 Tax=Micromonospora endolithica TaxID=230091 RepID=A0A3A9Z852_9ACTN|nr:glutamate-cysteine ligase family protein [Micromonospora endolithica]RKN43476.1 glutamate--cysteine ligase [Micromonospora endolithica]TWJ24057.1 glutamate--cysteine ligase [Micromonospora endolithica]